MKIEPVKESALMINSTGIGTVTREMVRKRATELAVIDGRTEQEASKSDWDQAKRELTGGLDMDPNEALLESTPESERWDPVVGSMGHIVPVPSIDGEDDDEGRSTTERLVEEGMLEAEHDQMVQAAKKQKQEDQ